MHIHYQHSVDIDNYLLSHIPGDFSLAVYCLSQNNFTIVYIIIICYNAMIDGTSEMGGGGTP